MTITLKQVDIGQPILTPGNHKSITLKKKNMGETKRRKIREELQKQLENKQQNGNKFIPTLQ